MHIRSCCSTVSHDCQRLLQNSLDRIFPIRFFKAETEKHLGKPFYHKTFPRRQELSKRCNLYELIFDSSCQFGKSELDLRFKLQLNLN